VRQRTFLYDTKSPDCRDQHMRANAWEGIGKELKIKRKFYVSARDVRIVCPRLKWPCHCFRLSLLWHITLWFHFRRLCPDISFFQQATDFPCQQVVHSRGVKRLHRRVEHTVLKSANVERKGLGVTKVSCYTQNTLVGLAVIQLSCECIQSLWR